jgi:hypothetical protein
MVSPVALTGSWVYERSDGVTLDLNDGVNIKLRHHDGFGIPEFQHAVTASPGLDGDYWFGVRYPPRIVTLDLTLYASGLIALENLRRTVISKLNPTGRSGKLKITQTNGTVRWFDCVLAESLPMPTTQHIGQRAMNLTVRFRSVGEPFLYDPVDKEYTVASGASGAGGNFMLGKGGMGFPFLLSQSGVFNEVVMTNPGDVPTPVEITLYGPGIEPVLRNDTLGRAVGFAGSGLNLPSGQMLVVNMDPRERDVTFQGLNGWPYLRESGFWWLEPGANDLSFEVSGSNQYTLLVMRYRERYLGL